MYLRMLFLAKTKNLQQLKKSTQSHFSSSKSNFYRNIYFRNGYKTCHAFSVCPVVWKTTHSEPASPDISTLTQEHKLYTTEPNTLDWASLISWAKEWLTGSNHSVTYPFAVLWWPVRC